MKGVTLYVTHADIYATIPIKNGKNIKTFYNTSFLLRAAKGWVI